jgi:uncharacterized UBP type Zn finger protein
MPRAIRPRSDADLRPCAHVSAARHLEPLSTGCPRCRERGEDGAELWRCLSCGWVACSDDSPNQHAKAHYEETDHPVAGPLWDDTLPRWCYVHKRTV